MLRRLLAVRQRHAMHAFAVAFATFFFRFSADV